MVKCFKERPFIVYIVGRTWTILPTNKCRHMHAIVLQEVPKSMLGNTFAWSLAKVLQSHQTEARMHIRMCIFHPPDRLWGNSLMHSATTNHEECHLERKTSTKLKHKCERRSVRLTFFVRTLWFALPIVHIVEPKMINIHYTRRPNPIVTCIFCSVNSCL